MSITASLTETSHTPLDLPLIEIMEKITTLTLQLTCHLQSMWVPSRMPLLELRISN